MERVLIADALGCPHIHWMELDCCNHEPDQTWLTLICTDCGAIWAERREEPQPECCGE